MKTNAVARLRAPTHIPIAPAYAGVLVVGVHGLVHLLGFVAFWPLAEVSQLPYRTALMGGRWEVGAGGIRAYAVLWLLAALGFAASIVGAITRQDWWTGLLLVVTLLSLVLTVLDWADARVGAVVDIVILATLLLGPRVIAGA